MPNDFTQDQQEALSSISIISSTLSFLGSSFILYHFFRYEDLRTFAFKLVALVSFCDLFNCVGSFMGNLDEGGACTFQAILIQFGSLGSMLWICVIAYSISEVVLKRNMNVEDNFKYYHIFVWVIATVMWILPFTTDNYGPSEGWCWIKTTGDRKTSGKVWRMLTFYIPLWLIIAYVIFIYNRTFKLLDKSSESFKRMRFYPAVLIVAYFFASVNRISQLFGAKWYGLTILHAFFGDLIGFFNAIVYGWTPAVKEKNKWWLIKVGLFQDDSVMDARSEGLLSDDNHPDMLLMDNGKNVKKFSTLDETIEEGENRRGSDSYVYRPVD